MQCGAAVWVWPSVGVGLVPSSASKFGGGAHRLYVAKGPTMQATVQFSVVPLRPCPWPLA